MKECLQIILVKGALSDDSGYEPVSNQVYSMNDNHNCHLTCCSMFPVSFISTWLLLSIIMIESRIMKGKDLGHFPYQSAYSSSTQNGGFKVNPPFCVLLIVKAYVRHVESLPTPYNTSVDYKCPTLYCFPYVALQEWFTSRNLELCAWQRSFSLGTSFT